MSWLGPCTPPSKPFQALILAKNWTSFSDSAAARLRAPRPPRQVRSPGAPELRHRPPHRSPSLSRWPVSDLYPHDSVSPAEAQGGTGTHARSQGRGQE